MKTKRELTKKEREERDDNIEATIKALFITAFVVVVFYLFVLPVPGKSATTTETIEATVTSLNMTDQYRGGTEYYVSISNGNDVSAVIRVDSTKFARFKVGDNVIVAVSTTETTYGVVFKFNETRIHYRIL